MILSGNSLYFSDGEVSTVNEIPKGNWLVKFDEMKGQYFLEKINDFIIPEKIYGNCDQLADRYLTTFNKYNDKNLGVALTGLKGTGKSLTAKITAIKSELPVIIVDVPHFGTTFNAFINSISQKCIIFIDEFEKIYHDKVEQQALLSLLDGVFMGNKLFLFTSNATNSYNNHLLNRPGRIHYLMDFDRINDATLHDIIDSTLINKSHKNKIIEIINLIDDANIDMVMALIREINDFGEDPSEAVKFLNIKLSSFSDYNVIYTTKNKIVYIATVGYNPVIRSRFSGEMQLDEDASLANKASKEVINKIIKKNGDYHYFDVNLGTYTLLKADSEGTILTNNKKETILIRRSSKFTYVF